MSHAADIIEDALFRLSERGDLDGISLTGPLSVPEEHLLRGLLIRQQETTEVSQKELVETARDLTCGSQGVGKLLCVLHQHLAGRRDYEEDHPAVDYIGHKLGFGENDYQSDPHVWTTIVRALHASALSLGGEHDCIQVETLGMLCDGMTDWDIVRTLSRAREAWLTDISKRASQGSEDDQDDEDEDEDEEDDDTRTEAFFHEEPLWVTPDDELWRVVDEHLEEMDLNIEEHPDLYMLLSLAIIFYRLREGDARQAARSVRPWLTLLLSFFDALEGEQSSETQRRRLRGLRRIFRRDLLRFRLENGLNFFRGLWRTTRRQASP